MALSLLHGVLGNYGGKSGVVPVLTYQRTQLCPIKKKNWALFATKQVHQGVLLCILDVVPCALVRWRLGLHSVPYRCNFKKIRGPMWEGINAQKMCSCRTLGRLRDARMRSMKLLFLAVTIAAVVHALSTHELMAQHTRIVGACMRDELGLSLPKERLASCAIASATSHVATAIRTGSVHCAKTGTCIH